MYLAAAPRMNVSVHVCFYPIDLKDNFLFVCIFTFSVKNTTQLMRGALYHIARTYSNF